jgi:hypothetical protein
MDARKYPGRDSNPHATKAVALKATVSDQFHHPGGTHDGTDSAPHIQAHGPRRRDGSQLTVERSHCYVRKNGVLASRRVTGAGGDRLCRARRCRTQP